ncbi:MAG: Na(+)/H(+) antiporter subunit D [Nitrospiria bacterium]
MIEWIQPSIFFFLGAAIIPFLKDKARSGVLLAIPVLGLLSMLIASEGMHGAVNFIGYDLVFGRVDKLSLGFGSVFMVSAFASLVFALHVKDTREHIAALLYVGSATGAVFAGDLFSFFLFWEMASFASVFLIWLRGEEKSSAAGMRYLLVHIVGGLFLFGGIVLHVGSGGGLAFVEMPKEGLASMLMLMGFLINAAVPPVHAWLADAYPEATVTGIIFLSVFTTKTAVYAMIRSFPGMPILVVLGAIMAVYGVMYAVNENNCQRVWCYHLISQNGYMVTGIGLGSELGLNSAASLAYTNIIYKALLMMGISSVTYMTGRRKQSELGGLIRTMPWTFVLFVIGGFAIAGVPPLLGFVSKSIVVTVAGEMHQGWVILMLVFGACGTWLHPLKLIYMVFMGEDKKIPASDPPDNMLWGMRILAGICIVFGVFPDLLYALLPYPMDYHPYTLAHLVKAFQYMGFTLLIFIVFLKKLTPENYISLDTDYIYRKATAGFVWVTHRLAFLRNIT